MREIKFRFWDANKKRFIDTENDNDYYYVVSDSGLPCRVYNDSCSSALAVMKHITISQYTGLKDKNGKEIYEGDISMNYYKGQWVNLVIVWNPLGMWSVKWKDGYLNNYHIQNQNMEVVGNIYQSPELI